jgi:hypothetical protein
MTIASRDQVRAAVVRALELDPESRFDLAIASVAQAMALPVEAVRQAVEPAEETQS